MNQHFCLHLLLEFLIVSYVAFFWLVGLFEELLLRLRNTFIYFFNRDSQKTTHSFSQYVSFQLRRLGNFGLDFLPYRIGFQPQFLECKLSRARPSNIYLIFVLYQLYYCIVSVLSPLGTIHIWAYHCAAPIARTLHDSNAKEGPRTSERAARINARAVWQELYIILSLVQEAFLRCRHTIAHSQHRKCSGAAGEGSHLRRSHLPGQCKICAAIAWILHHPHMNQV